jgi:hypothetical protein
MGKARAWRQRDRTDRDYHQFLISDYLADSEERSPEVTAIPISSSPPPPASLAERSSGPTAAAVDETRPTIASPAIRSRRSAAASAAPRGTARLAAAREPQFGWRGVLKGFLLGAIPGAGLILLCACLFG